MDSGIVAMYFMFIFSLILSQYGAEVYNITPSNPLAYGQSLVSPGQIFELGFFSPNSSANMYVGLWHQRIFPRKVVWVANRDNPLAVTDTLACLRIGIIGNLELVDAKESSVWSTNISNSSSAVLLDNGNFILRDVKGAVLWESFNNAGDSLLTGMLLGYDRGSCKNLLTSWRSENDPSPGLFLVGVSTELPLQMCIWKNGTIPIGEVDRGISQSSLVFFSYSLESIDDRFVSYTDISFDGIMRGRMSESGKNWYLDGGSSTNPCDSYGACGPYGVCKPSRSPICKCLKGFTPKFDEEWSKANWTGGCVRQTELDCERHTETSDSSIRKEYGFWKMENVKVPNFHEYLSSLASDKSEDCRTRCLSNCSCLAYTYISSIGCLVWSKDLIDIQEFPSNGQDIYVRLAHSELGESKPIKLIATLATIGFVSILVTMVFSLHRFHANNQKHKRMIKTYRDDVQEYIRKHDPQRYICLVLIAYKSPQTISVSQTNSGKEGLAQGILPDGKEIAVKRLSSCENKVLKSSRMRYR